MCAGIQLIMETNKLYASRMCLVILKLLKLDSKEGRAVFCAAEERGRRKN
jgi:hypothetical protein